MVRRSAWTPAPIASLYPQIAAKAWMVSSSEWKKRHGRPWLTVSRKTDCAGVRSRDAAIDRESIRTIGSTFVLQEMNVTD
jgi:hypothetical protein